MSDSTPAPDRPPEQRFIRVLGTGGTIAGTAPAGSPDNAYKAGQLAIEDLLRPVRSSLGRPVGEVQAVQVAQLDSRNMSHAVWQQLAAELQAGIDDPRVVGQVVTHGTDTLEETAVFLQGVLRGPKPVVITAAMRPATSAQADGPENLRRAIILAADPAARGVLVAFGGKVWPAVRVRKVHPFALQAFSGGDGEPVAEWLHEAGRWCYATDGDALDAGPDALQARPPARLSDDPEAWPRIEIVHSHAGADGRIIDLLLDDSKPTLSASPRPGEASTSPRDKRVAGLVISATGNGSIHDGLHLALQRAVATGRLHRSQILVATRCTQGWVVGEPEHGWPVARDLTPAQARVALMLELGAQRPPLDQST